jgi:hypothetical protein
MCTDLVQDIISWFFSALNSYKKIFNIYIKSKHMRF